MIIQRLFQNQEVSFYFDNLGPAPWSLQHENRNDVLMTTKKMYVSPEIIEVRQREVVALMRKCWPHRAKQIQTDRLQCTEVKAAVVLKSSDCDCIS